VSDHGGGNGIIGGSEGVLGYRRVKMRAIPRTSAMAKVGTIVPSSVDLLSSLLVMVVLVVLVVVLISASGVRATRIKATGSRPS